MNLDKGTAYQAFHHLPTQTSMTYSQPAPANIVANLALFQFKTRDGSAPKPNSPVMTGSLQFSMEQLQLISVWAQGQQPDAYGKIRLSVSVWQEVSAQGQPYLKGNAKTPMPNVAGPMVTAMESQQQAANQTAQNQVYGGARYPGHPAVVGQQQPSSIPYNPWPNVQTPQTPGMPPVQPTATVTGPMPAWNNQDAWQQQQQASVPMQTASAPQGPSSLPMATTQPPQAPLPQQPQQGTPQPLPGTQSPVTPTAQGNVDGNPPF